MDIIGVVAAMDKFYTNSWDRKNGFCTSWSKSENPPRTIMYFIKKRLYAKARGRRHKLQGNRRNKHGLGDRQRNWPYQLPQLAKETAFPANSTSGIVETV